MKERGLGPLASGSTVVVIGGGPAGSASAIALKQEARALARDIRVVIVEGKRFAGEQHYNQCAGVLSPPIAALIENELGLPFPRHLSRNSIDEYVLHDVRRSIELRGDAEPSLSVRRVQFDAYMLDAARERGVEVLTARAVDLERRDEGVTVFTESGPLEATVVVGAFGVDDGSSAFFQRATSYRPPPTLGTIVTKCHPGAHVLKRFEHSIHAFLPPSPEIEFGAIIPKGNHLTFIVAGVHVSSGLMERFLALPEVRRALAGWDGVTCLERDDRRNFKGRFPCGLAGGYSGDRFVIVGDAAGLVRAFKGKGVTSAVRTGIRAARVILEHGISSEAFRAFRKANRDIISDIPYGRAMRFVTIHAARLGLMSVVLRAADRDEHLRQALFDAVSAHRPYREVARHVLRPRSILALLAALVPRRQNQPS